MKAQKWLTITTLTVSIVALVAAFIIGKDSNCIYYDIAMALLGSDVLGFIMSITEYYVERRKAMEEFWIQATSVLIELRKIKHLDLDAPLKLIIEALEEEYSNERKPIFSILSKDKELLHHEAKNKLISWFEEKGSFF